MPKPKSGIGRSGRGSKRKKMSPEDAWLLQRDEEYLRSTPGIPDYIKPGMTTEEMESAIVKHIRETGKGVSVSGYYLPPEDIDGRFPPPKNERFSELVKAINATDMTQIPEIPSDRKGRDSPYYYRLERRVEELT